MVRASLISCTVLGVLSGLSTGGQNLLPIRPETTPLIASMEGPDLYKAYCANCHGVSGKGDGPMAQALVSHLPDLTTIARRNRGTFPRDRVEKIISGEEELTTAHGSREMPLWGPVFSQIVWDMDLGHVRIHNLALYLEKMQKR